MTAEELDRTVKLGERVEKLRQQHLHTHVRPFQ
jgi:hypothetical protein